MTWWSEHSAVPGFVFAKLAIRCLFVDRFVGSRVPSLVSSQRFSTHDASLPSAGSRQAQFPVVISTMKALRLPAHANLVPYSFGSRLHTLLLSSCSPRRSCRAWGSTRQARDIVQPASLFPAFRAWARAGSHKFPGDPSYAFALLYDPGRVDEISPLRFYRYCPRAIRSRGPRRVQHIGATTGPQHPLSTLHE